MARFSLLDRILIPTYNDPGEMTLGEVAFDYEKCGGCSLCVQACPADTLLFEDKKPCMRPPGLNECMACADCVAICPEGAVQLTRGYRFTKYFKTIDHGELRGPRLGTEE